MANPSHALAGFGPAGSHVVFHPHFDALAEDHHSLRDLHGRGRSEAPDDLHTITFATDVDDVAALLCRLNLGPVHIYGFSYGGLLAQALALGHPDLVKSIVLANSLSSPEMWQQNHANINREIANQCPEIWTEIQRLRSQGFRSTDPRMSQLFGRAARVVRFFDPDKAALVATEPGAEPRALPGVLRRRRGLHRRRSNPDDPRLSAAPSRPHCTASHSSGPIRPGIVSGNAASNLGPCTRDGDALA